MKASGSPPTLVLPFFPPLTALCVVPFTPLLLQSYLMFGNTEHLQMFTQLYGSVMQQLQVCVCMCVCACVCVCDAATGVCVCSRI